MRIRRIRQLAVVAFLVLTGQGGATTEPARATRPGDVLFFELDGKKVSHVGIYAGAGRFEP